MTRDDIEAFDSVLRAVASSPHVTPGRGVLGERFRLGRRLGGGGFGVVYEAEDLRDGGRVALKLLRQAEASWLYRFKREFRALQGLAHPNLVVLDELFGDGERWFFTMELVEGVDFIGHVRDEEPVRGAGFHEAKLRDGLRQLFDGLAVLHTAGKVHRDIKPSNVLVTRAGRVVLIDFGLITDAFQTTESGTIGTPAYMAPEQAASGQVGPAADLYAVGVMLHELLTGRMPFDGRLLQVLIDKQARDPPPPAAIAPGIPDDLNDLCVKLLQRDPARRPSTAEVRRALAASETTASAGPAPSPEATTFVGRSAELAELRAAFQTSTGGRLAAVLIAGESGIGKSHLVQRFTERLLAERPDTMLLEGRCHEREVMPYKALDGIVDALSRRFSRMPASTVAAMLPTQRATLARLFPVMLRVPQLARESAAAAAAALNVEPQVLRQRAFLALRELFARVAMDRPTVIAVDDLQWADEDGMRGLAEILRPPDAPPLLFVGTVRTSRGQRDTPLDRWRATIPGEVRVIELASLGSEDARALATGLLRRAGAAHADPQRIASEAGGHPLFVEELARHAALGATASGAGEVRLDDAIWSRVAQLQGPARDVAELIAVAGKPLPQDVAAAAAHLEPTGFQRNAAVLRASNLARTDGARWEDAIEPYHDRVREAVLARLEPARRRALHEALAVAFEASSRVDAETLAVHWREAGNRALAASYAGAAGDQASRTFAFDRASSWFEQALELLPGDHARRRELQIKLGDALALAGRGALAARQFETAATASPAAEALELRRRAAEQLLRSGHFDRGMEAYRGVLAGLGMRIPGTRFRVFASLAYYSLRLRLRGLKFRARDRGEISAEERTKMDTCWSIGVALAFVETLVGVVFLRRALLLALQAGDLDRSCRALGMIAGSNGATSLPWSKVQRLVRRTGALAEQSGSVEARAYAGVAAGAAFFLRGRFREAEERLAGALNVLQDGATGLVHERVTTRMFLIWSLAYLGRYRDLRRCQREGLRDARARGDVYAEVNLVIGSANMAWLAEDRPDIAESEARAAMERWSTRGFHLEHYFALTGQIWSRVYAGDAAAGHGFADELVRRTKESLLWRLPIFRLRALYARAASALAAVEQRVGDRTALLREAARDARAIERARLVWLAPFARLLRAGIALREGARDKALATLEAAARELAAQDLSGYAAATRDRAARLRNDAGAAQEIARVADLMKAEEIVAPDRMIAMLVPGLSVDC